jgi:hypothetical protein
MTFVTAAIAVVGIACCAGLPVIAAVLGGVTLAAVLGVAGGLLAVAALVAAALFALRARRRRACSPQIARKMR